MRVPRAAIATLAVMVLVVGCGSGAKPRTSATTAAPTIQATPSAATTTTAVSSGIVVQTCLHSNGRKLSFVNPQTKSITATRTFYTSNYVLQVDCTPIARGRDEQRSSYNKNFTLLAAQRKLPGGFHTGVIASGQSDQDTSDRFKDLSGASDGGFSAEVKQSVGAFQPSTDNLYFVQEDTDSTKRLMTVASTGGVQQQSSPADVRHVNVEGGYPNNYGVYFAPNNDQPLFKFDSYLVAAPDGSWGFWSTGNGTAYGKPGTIGTLVKNVPTPWIYLNKTSYIGLGVRADQLLLVTVSNGAAQTKSLLPATDGMIKSPMLSPDGSTVVFILDKPSSRVLYTVPVAGGTVTKIVDLDNTVTTLGIVDWL